MTQSLAWLSRLAAIALLLVLLGGAYFLGVSPLIAAYRQNTDSLKEAENLLARFQIVAAAEDGLQEKMREIGERHALQRYYLIKDTDALAAAEIQDRIKAAVQQHGGTIRSIQTLPADNEGELRRVILRMQMTTTIAALFRIVHALETGQPLLFIDTADIQSRATQQTGQDAEPVLTVSLDVYGYRSPEDP